ncbi:hypothetical protein CU098_011190 [Rhizopus stolonifer]|uniref:Uncharacterized protein n=1 Tax=Rhizopus stolonifer TaxID=4846 RepID=A0A367KTU0_RHIST|nr:hypothetical protein CU098_011190 [Rhizopus stolonifer]
MSALNSLDQAFDSERVMATDGKLKTCFSEDDLRKHNKTSSQLYKNNKKKSHSRASSSVSFDIHKGHSKSQNSIPCNHHTRGHSWSEASLTAVHAPRSSHDSIRSGSFKVGQNSTSSSSQDQRPPHGKDYVQVKTKIKTNKRFNRIVLAQTLAIDSTGTEVYAAPGVSSVAKDIEPEEFKQPMGAIWATRFSKDGKYMATGGQNCIIHVWKVLRDLDRSDNITVQDILPHQPSIKVFHDAPVRIYAGHTADVLDLSWSKNNFLLSSSMDKTVRLWHVSQAACLCVFSHSDVVASVRFHPKDDRFFLSGSLDSKIRLWSIPEKRVAFWNDIESGNMVTAVGFTFDGRIVCIGSNTGDVFFYETQGLKYNTQIAVKNRGHKHGRKITGIEPMPGMPLGEERILVTTNDSRVWIINLKDKSFVYKYKGIENHSMQIKASFSDDGRYIICGSEDGCVYLWCTDQVSYSPLRHWRDSRLGSAAGLCSLGDQVWQTMAQQGAFSDKPSQNIMSSWLRRGERRVIDKLRSRNEHFFAHMHAVTTAIFAPTKTRQLLARSGGDIILDYTPVYSQKKANQEEEDEEDNVFMKPRRSVHFSAQNSTASTNTKTDKMKEFEKAFTIEFEEASQEERDRFDYPESQIIISADLHGAIKVWRMDSGHYGNNNESSDQEDDSDESDSENISTSDTKSDKSNRKRFFSKLFTKAL